MNETSPRNTKVLGYGDYIIMDIDENGKIADWANDDIKDFLTR